jgi:hypothetical protein
LTVDASVAQVPVAQVCDPRTKPCVAETKVTDAGLKPASETAGAVVAATEDETAGALVGAAGDETAGADEVAADVAGAAGDETAGVLEALGVLTGALLPGEAVCVLLEQPAAAKSATSMMPLARVVHEVVMRSRTQQGRVRVHVNPRRLRHRQSS